MIAGAGGGEQRGGNRGKTRWEQGHASAGIAVDFAQSIFERRGGRRPAAPVVVTRTMGDLIFGSRIEKC